VDTPFRPGGLFTPLPLLLFLVVHGRVYIYPFYYFNHRHFLIEILNFFFILTCIVLTPLEWNGIIKNLLNMTRQKVNRPILTNYVLYTHTYMYMCVYLCVSVQRVYVFRVWSKSLAGSISDPGVLCTYY
jgi:hypothetical protein